MSVLDCPDEILGEIISLIALAAGLNEAMKLRLICQRFNALAQDCIFYLPRTILRSKGMSEPMRIKLIRSRMRTESPNNLCCAIRSTVDFLTQLTSPELHEEFTESLIRLAVRSMMYWYLIDSLSTSREAQISSHEIQQNALVAVAETGRSQLVKKLLSENLNSTCNTQYFGEVFAAAASSGSLSVVLILLESWDWDSCTHIPSTRYVHAVQAAAVNGHEHIVLTLLDRGRPLPKSMYDDAIVQTVKDGPASIVKLLLDRRQEHLDGSREREFWSSIVRASVEWDSLEVLQYLVGKDLAILGEATIGLAIEDACRKCYDKGLEILLSGLQNFSIHEAEHYTGGLFWAAWSGTSEHLVSLVTIFQQDQHQILRALAGAFSGKRRDNIAYLLRSAGVHLTDRDLPTRFTDAAHLILPEALCRSSGQCPRSINFLAQSALEASKSGDLGGVIEAFQAAKFQYPNNNLRSFSGAFSAAADDNHPEILLYLCENRTPHLVTACATSTHIVRIFQDFGWDVNQADNGSKYPRLGNFVHDAHFCRWLIDNGASLSTRGEMDVTPISVAVCRAPMSTIRLFLGRCGGIRGGQLLHFAVERENEDAVEVIELVLNLGCCIDGIMFQDDPRSWMEWKLGEPATPLFSAAQKGKREIVKFLLARGANPTKPSIKGCTPLDIAERNGYTSIVDLLKQCQ